MAAVSGDIARISKLAARLQRNYDKQTVKSITDLASVMMESGMGRFDEQ